MIYYSYDKNQSSAKIKPRLGNELAFYARFGFAPNFGTLAGYNL